MTFCNTGLLRLDVHIKFRELNYFDQLLSLKVICTVKRTEMLLYNIHISISFLDQANGCLIRVSELVFSALLLSACEI